MRGFIINHLPPVRAGLSPDPEPHDDILMR